MRAAVVRLQARRERLLRQAATERWQLAGHLDRINGTLGRADRYVETARRIATRPVLVAGGVALVFLLGRGQGRRILTAGLTGLGLLRRAQSAGGILGMLGRVGLSQLVRRSR